MKQLLLALTLALTATASADTHYLTFEQHNGQQRSLPLVGLNITFKNGQMLAESQGEAFALDLISLQRMFFALQPTGVEQVQRSHADEPSVVYDLQGRRVVGAEGQTKGIYIIQDGEGARKEIKR